MNNFVYYTPTKVVFGTGVENEAGALLNEMGAKKVLIHYGGGSVVRTGLLERVEQSLKNANLPYVTLGGVVPNPLLSKVYEGIALCKKENVDFVLAVGGGSTIDSSKAIGMGLCYEGDVWDFFSGKATPKDCAPLGTVLTLAAAGSEMSNSCVITKDEGMLKRAAGTEKMICKFALMNPELTKTLPDYQTASGCVDIIMHTMERYFENNEKLDITDDISESIMRSVMQNAKILKQDPQNTKARWNVMWGGSLAHNGLTGCATKGGDWATHMIEHELGGMFDVTHGAGLAAVWGSWARYVLDIIPHRLEKFALRVLDVAPQSTQKETALKGIEAMEDFYRSIDMPTSLKELGVHATDAQLKEMAEKATNFGEKTVGTVRALQASDIQIIYQNANK